MKILELFSGTESFSKVARERGHECFTIDNNSKFNPSLCKDINEVTFEDLPFYPDVIWCSPPCTFFSVASIGKHWNKDNTPKTEQARQGIELVKSMTTILEIFNVKFWIIENPRGKLRKLGLIPSEPKTVTYCQYGDERMKPTDIWTNLKWNPRPICKNGDSCHVAAPRGSRTGTQGRKNNMERSRVPRELCLELIKCCESANK